MESTRIYTIKNIFQDTLKLVLENSIILKDYELQLLVNGDNNAKYFLKKGLNTIELTIL